MTTDRNRDLEGRVARRVLEALKELPPERRRDFIWELAILHGGPSWRSDAAGRNEDPSEDEGSFSIVRFMFVGRSLRVLIGGRHGYIPKNPASPRGFKRSRKSAAHNPTLGRRWNSEGLQDWTKLAISRRRHQTVSSNTDGPRSRLELLPQ